MARLIRYKPSFRGIKQVRSSRGVDMMLAGRARRVAEHAELLYSVRSRISGEDQISVDVVQAGSDTSEPRARVAVIARHPAALRIEADQRVLGIALTAAGVSPRNIKKKHLQMSRRLEQRAARRQVLAARRRARREQRDAELFAAEEAV